MTKKEYIKKWKLANKEKTNAKRREWYAQLRLQAFNLISKGSIKCIRCGETKYKLLQVNHKNGGGNKEKLYHSDRITFFRHIILGKRKIDDLEITCQPCNYLHLAELLSGRKYAEVH